MGRWAWSDGYVEKNCASDRMIDHAHCVTQSIGPHPRAIRHIQQLADDLDAGRGGRIISEDSQVAIRRARQDLAGSAIADEVALAGGIIFEAFRAGQGLRLDADRGEAEQGEQGIAHGENAPGSRIRLRDVDDTCGSPRSRARWLRTQRRWPPTRRPSRWRPRRAAAPQPAAEWPARAAT